jgi:PhnB protein
MGSDTPPGWGTPGYNGITVSLYIKQDVEKARKAFEALAAGGQVKMPFAPPFWGGHFGMLTDKFGVPWMVSCE